eukprot:TRINITY_DN27895_c0_g1_i1.p1 TRINITY_DN27895_c0_g1~~TRINITY_DN27895_c0_g1_i1.p1  ORF type:complete len:385 (-),score=26.44 TRINITY_DN27895_c0_g1_i1:92-1117(-)
MAVTPAIASHRCALLLPFPLPPSRTRTRRMRVTCRDSFVALTFPLNLRHIRFNKALVTSLSSGSENATPYARSLRCIVDRGNVASILERRRSRVRTCKGFQPSKFLLRVQWLKISAFVFVVLLIGFCHSSFLCESALATAAGSPDSIRASSMGLKIASFMRRSGWPDEVIVFALASLPVLELRGAIPVGYWMQLKPLDITLLSILGNMLPVPFILLYLKRLLNYLENKSSAASKVLNWVVNTTKKKAGPIEEFKWLGLALFVAVPFPGTGAWSGAIAATLLDMPFFEAISANFFGVVGAGLLVNLLVNLGIKYAFIVGCILFFVSTVMWSFLRFLRKSRMS